MEEHILNLNSKQTHRNHVSAVIKSQSWWEITVKVSDFCLRFPLTCLPFSGRISPLGSKAFGLSHTDKDSSDKEVLFYQFPKWPCLAFIRYPVPTPGLTTVNSDWTWTELSSKLREEERGRFQKEENKENLRRSSTKKDTRKAKTELSYSRCLAHSLVYSVHSVWMLLLE